jgi:beta-hydroxylase
MDLLLRLREGVIERAVKPSLERMLLRSSKVPTTPFLDPAVFPWIADLERNWKKIRTELDAVLDRESELPNFQSISSDVGRIADDDLWKTFFFVGFGHKGESNLANCPETAALLGQVPGLVTAFFSILEPGKHIPEHRGPYRGVLRYHLGLRIPDPPESTGITVDGETRRWGEGQSLLFDDCYVHSAWNDSNETRVVLFLDIVRPTGRIAGWVNRAVIKIIALSPFMAKAQRSHDEWEQAFYGSESTTLAH